MDKYGAFRVDPLHAEEVREALAIHGSVAFPFSGQGESLHEILICQDFEVRGQMNSGNPIGRVFVGINGVGMFHFKRKDMIELIERFRMELDHLAGDVPANVAGPDLEDLIATSHDHCEHVIGVAYAVIDFIATDGMEQAKPARVISTNEDMN